MQQYLVTKNLKVSCLLLYKEVSLWYNRGMKAVVSVVGRDRTGITAAVSGALAERNINIEDISQTIMHGSFVMIMRVDMTASTVGIDELGKQLQSCADSLGVAVRVQHEDLFNAMHRV